MSNVAMSRSVGRIAKSLASPTGTDDIRQRTAGRNGGAEGDGTPPDPIDNALSAPG
jgi:hypothetical protein